MSDAKEPEIEVESNGSDSELTKEERIEAARKKFEELKKKKNKKKKNKKKATEETGTEDSESKDVTPAVEDNTNATGDDEHKEREVNSEIEEELVKQPEPKEEAKEEPKEEKEEKEVKEAKEAKEAKEVKEVKEDPKEEKKEVEDDENVAKQASKPEINTKLEETLKKEPETEAKGEPIQNQSELQDEIDSLKTLVEQQANTIKKLRDENTDLKLSRMDLNDTIAELQQQVEQLKSGSSTVFPGSFSASQIPEQTKVASAAKPIFTSNDYASESRQDLTIQQVDDFRERLMAWKGWQVDMTHWNGVGHGQKLAI